MDPTVPSLMHACVLTPGGPFEAGDMLSVAFSNPTVGRLLPHINAEAFEEAHRVEASDEARSAEIVPDAISVRIETDAQPYSAGDVVTLSFTRPFLARIHAGVRDAVPPPTEHGTAAGTPVPQPPQEDSVFVDDARDVVEFAKGIRVRTVWTVERARRFVHVVDKLFTIDRLGWYRHVLAMRLLIPDEIDCGDVATSAEATSFLHALRSAATETLGRPLLAAFMPNFSVTAEWLETIDNPALARALGDLRGVIAPHAGTACSPPLEELEPAWAFGYVRAEDVSGVNASSVDAFIATLIPSSSANVTLAAHLDGYRRALADVFTQTARSAEAVRLGRMCEPNHTLDDRLWQLVGTIGTSFDALAVA